MLPTLLKCPTIDILISIPITVKYMYLRSLEVSESHSYNVDHSICLFFVCLKRRNMYEFDMNLQYYEIASDVKDLNHFR